MTSVITGDIINSRKLKNPQEWLTPLKSILEKIGKTPKIWELSRGDSFQLEILRPEKSLLTAIKIKAAIKCVKGADVRMAIGIGSKNFETRRISESNGEAFIYSGEKFENLQKEKQNLAVKTPWETFDAEINLYLKLMLLVMDEWTPGAAEVVNIALKNKNAGQLEIAKKLGISQSSVSERQKRAHLSEILQVESLFQEKIKQLKK